MCDLLPAQAKATHLDDNQRRWLSVGIALHTVLVPKLRTFVEEVIDETYQHYLHQNPPINAQTYNKYHKEHGKSTLLYKNINDNDKVTEQPAKRHYNYNVKCHVDFAKLFLQTHMAKFTTFKDTDASALLGLVLNVDDSICNTPQFKQVETGAQELRNVRNTWAHCNITEWNEDFFQNSFQIMEQFLKHILSPPDQTSLMQELKNIKQCGK